MIIKYKIKRIKSIKIETNKQLERVLIDCFDLFLISPRGNKRTAKSLVDPFGIRVLSSLIRASSADLYMIFFWESKQLKIRIKKPNEKNNIMHYKPHN